MLEREALDGAKCVLAGLLLASPDLAVRVGGGGLRGHARTDDGETVSRIKEIFEASAKHLSSRRVGGQG